jgi:hypothetical protein
MSEPRLGPHERAWLRAVCAPEVPDGFADAVMQAAETGASTPSVASRRIGRLAATVGVVVAVAAAVLVWLATVPRPSEDVIRGHGVSRSQATRILVAHCGTCHDRSEANAPPAAWTAFDLGDPSWVDGMSADALRALVDRIDARDDVPAVDRRRVGELVAQELASRRG